MKTIKKAHVAAVAQTQVVDGQTVSGDVVGVGAGVDFTNTLVTNHGSLRVNAGGTATGTTVDGSFLEVSAGGKSVGAVLKNESEEDVFGTATGTTLKGGDLNVWKGGVLQDSVIDGGSGGDVNDGYILAGGKAVNTTLNGTGAVLNLEPGSLAVGTVANNGAVEFVGSTAVSDSAIVNSSSYEYQLFANSTSKNLTVNNGGNGVIVGTLDGATINQGGLVTASDGTVVKGSIADNGNLTFHLNGTEHFAGNLTGTGVLEVQGGMLVADSALNFNGTAQIDSSSTLELAGASNAHVKLSDFQSTLKLDHSQSFTGTISGLGVRTLDLIDLADVAFSNGEKASFAENAAATGGTLTIANASGQVMEQLTLLGDYTGDAFVLASDRGSGTDISVVVAPVAQPPVVTPPPGSPPPSTPPTSVDGGTVTGTVVGVGAGVDFTNTLVTDHGSLRVNAGGMATATTVDGGFLEVSAGGKSVGAVLLDESEEDVFGTSTGTTLKGGDLNVWAGGVLQDSVIDGGSNGDVNDGYIIAGGKAINTTLNGTGAVLNLEPASNAVGTVINNGAVEFVGSTAVSDSAVVNSGSYEYQLFANSTDKNLTVNSGGNGVIVGTLDGATINQGGLVTASDGTVVKGSITDNGNLTFHLNSTEHFAGNLTGTGKLEVQGGTLVVDGALNFNGTAQVDATSTLELAGASNAHVNFGTFESTLKLDHSQSFTGTVAGTAGSLDTIDLADLAFVKGVTTMSFTENAQHTGGVLTVSDQAMGGPVVNLNLLGNYNAAAFTFGADALVNNENMHPGTAIHGPF